MVVAILLAVFVNSLFILPAVILLWMWNKETPTLKREKIRVGNGEKISRHNII
tara:strand:- start:231 stop:389 length:159 start_codon:yes stop_codon:yes gene_type:complete